MPDIPENLTPREVAAMNCKACGGTGKSSRGFACVCQLRYIYKHEELNNLTTQMLADPYAFSHGIPTRKRKKR